MSPSGNEASLTPNAPGLRRPETPLKVMDFGVLPPKSGLGKGGGGGSELQRVWGGGAKGAQIGWKFGWKMGGFEQFWGGGGVDSQCWLKEIQCVPQNGGGSPKSGSFWGGGGEKIGEMGGGTLRGGEKGTKCFRM